MTPAERRETLSPAYGFVTRRSVRLMRPPSGNQSRRSVDVPE